MKNILIRRSTRRSIDQQPSDKRIFRFTDHGSSFRGNLRDRVVAHSTPFCRPLSNLGKSNRFCLESVTHCFSFLMGIIRNNQIDTFFKTGSYSSFISRGWSHFVVPKNSIPQVKQFLAGFMLSDGFATLCKSDVFKNIFTEGFQRRPIRGFIQFQSQRIHSSLSLIEQRICPSTLIHVLWTSPVFESLLDLQIPGLFAPHVADPQKKKLSDIREYFWEVWHPSPSPALFKTDFQRRGCRCRTLPPVY